MASTANMNPALRGYECPKVTSHKFRVSKSYFPLVYSVQKLLPMSLEVSVPHLRPHLRGAYVPTFLLEEAKIEPAGMLVNDLIRQL